MEKSEAELLYPEMGRRTPVDPPGDMPEHEKMRLPRSPNAMFPEMAGADDEISYSDFPRLAAERIHGALENGNFYEVLSHYGAILRGFGRSGLFPSSSLAEFKRLTDEARHAPNSKKGELAEMAISLLNDLKKEV